MSISVYYLGDTRVKLGWYSGGYVGEGTKVVGREGAMGCMSFVGESSAGRIMHRLLGSNWDHVRETVAVRLGPHRGLQLRVRAVGPQSEERMTRRLGQGVTPGDARRMIAGRISSPPCAAATSWNVPHFYLCTSIHLNEHTWHDIDDHVEHPLSKKWFHQSEDQFSGKNLVYWRSSRRTGRCMPWCI